MDDPRTRWSSVCKTEAGLHGGNGASANAGLFLQIRQYEMTLPGAKNVRLQRQQFLKGTSP